jgi:dTDP-4-amino-4,6-dideoxy-D-glucose transaminase
METEKLPLTKPFVPPIEEFQNDLRNIWESRQLTNSGPVHLNFEKDLCKYLETEHISLFANGTLALITALRALNLKGEVITTPFTSLATAHSILWNGLKPVFVDINELDFNINPLLIEKKISSATKALLPVHIFGNPCDVSRIDKIARSNNLKVIYDAAHCFGIRVNNIPLCNSGDMSVLSFHATKVFNTIEGGAIICHDPRLKKHIDALKNNGSLLDNHYYGLGLNAKLNELQCAIGLLNLKYFDRLIDDRRESVKKYRQLLSEINGIKTPVERDNVTYNYSYLPVIIEPENFKATRNELHDFLYERNIITRKYFYPLITDHPTFSKFKSGDLPIARKIADSILCLPLFHDIKTKEISLIAHLIHEFHHSRSRNKKNQNDFFP